MRTLLIALSLFLGCVQCTPFQATVTLPSRFESGHEVVCTVTITNRDTRNHYLYNRNTPQEGLKSDIFQVTRNGSPIPYDGLFFKRSPVTGLSKRILLKSNESITVSLDLTTGYSLTVAGSYAISLNTRIYFLYGDDKIQQVDLQSAPATFEVYEGENIGTKMTVGEKYRFERSKYRLEVKDGGKVTGTPKSVTFAGSYDSVDSSQATDAWSRAYTGVVNSISDMTKNPSHYKYWFGTTPQSTVWSGTFSKLKAAMEQKTFRLFFRSSDCEVNVYAYTYYGSDTIYLCDSYIYAQAYGYNSKFGTIVHEMTHAVAGTKDLAYGEYDCLNLAQTNPNSAVMNADNYEYFVESL